MKIKKLIKYYLLGESLKDIELNRILNKIGDKKELSNRESNFIDLYKSTTQDKKDYMLLSKNSTSAIIEELLELNIKVICDISDKNGNFGLRIIETENDIENNITIIKMRNETHYLEDRYLYNLIFNSKKNEYSLQEQDEYFEKITIDNDN